MQILVTGAAGFIGFHLVEKILQNKKDFVVGIDNLNSYYDVKLKKNRLSILKKYKNFRFKKIDINNYKKVEKIFKENKFKIVINLAAQAGVRYSIENPKNYFENNIRGFFNIIDLSRHNKIKHFLYASTSSVYGNQNKYPLKESFSTDGPLSFYAATKKCNEVIAHSYSNIYGIPSTGFRFFTVYGPYGRPDMALFKFVKAILQNKYIHLFNKGDHFRDFTYIDDIVMYIESLIKKPSKDAVPYKIFNIGSDKPYSLTKFLSLIETSLNKKAKIKLVKAQLGDVHKTHASIDNLKKITGLFPKVKLKKGIKSFINWYKDYYKNL
tara:strand:- start:91 stop:1062 length:972 start_codon:yes stop_codon:yes gene_type:complete